LYNSIKIEVDNMRQMLDSLVQRQNQTEVSANLEGLKISSISIIDKAEVPEAPVSPNKRRNMLIAILLGLFGGIGLCFVLEHMDKSVKGADEVEKIVGLPSLGLVPHIASEDEKEKMSTRLISKWGRLYKTWRLGKENLKFNEVSQNIHKIELVNHLYPKFSVSEDYRTIRTAILLSHSENPPKTIVFSSALPQEGKSVTTANMAVSFAQLQKRVLVLDADMRIPNQHRIFDKKRDVGLSGILTGNVSVKTAVQKTDIENLWLLPSGQIPPNPAELLNSKKMQELIKTLEAEYDVVLIDTPPILAVIDAVIIASLSDVTILVLQGGKTAKKPFTSAVNELNRAGANVIGVLFNRVKLDGGGYYSKNYGYYRHRSYQSDQEDEAKKI
jgi:capsular exopolysaccharide synthesis family protein